jgi:hypothetical protein
MKTKNQTEPSLPEFAVTSAANEEGFTSPTSRDGANGLRKQAWSPKEVWRTRVKPAELGRGESAPV